MSVPLPRTLHSFYRSGASWRVRIALNLKGLSVGYIPYHLRRGDQKHELYLRLNPQGLVPSLEIADGRILTQSLAIIEWLEENWPQPPVLPDDSTTRARVRAFALAIACDLHPLQNIGVLNRLSALGLSERDVISWARDTCLQGLSACQEMLPSKETTFLFGEKPTLADICLIPQLANARRFQTDLSGLSRLLAVEAACNALPAFIAALPAHQPDAE